MAESTASGQSVHHFSPESTPLRAKSTSSGQGVDPHIKEKNVFDNSSTTH
jgi:hypothetical protein